MPGGRYHHRVDIRYDAASTPDAYGELVEVPTTLHRNVPCNVRTVAGDERKYAHRVEAGASHVVTFPRSAVSADVTVQRWLLWGTRRLNITEVTDGDNRRTMIDAVCQEVK